MGTVSSIALGFASFSSEGLTGGQSSGVIPSGSKMTARELDLLGRRLNRWKEATHRYARHLQMLGVAPDREYWINRFLRAASKAGRASQNYQTRMESGAAPLTGPCFGSWCSPPVRRPV
jgi:hypothetical protein